MRILKFIQVSLLAGIMISHTGCNDDFLNLDPSDSISDDKVFTSYETAQAALVGAYDQLSSHLFEGLYEPIISDIIGGDAMVNSVDNWNWFVEVYQMKILPAYAYAESPWWAGYKTIYDANNIIANVASIPSATEEQRNQLEGEAKVLRAFVMLKLVQMYAPAYKEDKDAPSIMLTNRLLELDEDLPRAPLSEVYVQIEEDLLSAINLLEYEDEKGFFDKRAAQAILARAYLNKEEWEKARDMAVAAYTDIILVPATGLLDGFNFRNTETIFTVAYTAEDNNVFLSLPSFYYPAFGYSSMRANDTFVEKFASSDARSYHFSMDLTIDEDRHVIEKFQHWQTVGNAERISIRASEMYLIEAECEAELGNFSKAQDALYTIQVRANLLAEKTTASGQELIDEILLERRKELFGEGFGWNDIKRRLSPYTRTGDHWVDVNFDFGDDDYFRLTYPIPQSEIDANSMISSEDQNKGY